MKYNCEWLKHHINDTDPTTFPCEWAKENWHKTISQITEPFPCDNLREKWEGGGNYRTVLYTDGTFIINEKESDIVNNVALHGDAINVYPALDATYPYEFNDPTERYWDTESSLIKSVEFGSEVKPTKTAWWFASMGNLTGIDWAGLDTSEVVNMENMFSNCYSLTELNLLNFNTSSVMYFDYMFYSCVSLKTIYVKESFDMSSLESGESMFYGCRTIVGGSGTTYQGDTYEYARIDNPPTEPGYFTAK